MRRFVVSLLFSLVVLIAPAQIKFDEFFIDKTLRYDYILGGTDTSVVVYPVQMKQEKCWGGPTKNLVSPFGFGTYRYQIFDVATNQLIFSKGFNTLFQEWQATAEAKSKRRTYYQAAILPFPKKKIKLNIDARQRNGKFITIYSDEVDPRNYFIKKEKSMVFADSVIVKNGNLHDKVDIVILAEGYTDKEKDKFWKDSERMCNAFFDIEPYKSDKKSFNVTAVFTPSVDSGTDSPGDSIYKNTKFNSSFYTFDISRYLTTSDMKSIYDVAADYAYDQLYVLTNTKKYGGGGFYNLLSLCASDGKFAEEVFIHEFGHAFAGLADEYYTSSVAVEDFYNLSVEPWEANLTTLKNFDKKWKNMLSPSVPIPTPREKKYKDTLGVYEGGGYTAKGVYSPQMDCRMKTNTTKDFCPVCRKTIKRMIDYYCNR
ncbi:MAG: peptidase [Draconibacterium sp.]|nr:MAG: peptidase [Draconibacterium sp.]